MFVAMRVIIAHHVAADLGGFAETAIRRQPQFAHREQYAPMHGFQPVARIGQRTVHDRAERIGQVPVADGTAQRFGHFRRVDVGGVHSIRHR
jgi:hypothetical protein